MTQTAQLALLEQRLLRLEAIDAIKTLKSRYFLACDTKNPEMMRQCFVDGKVHIDYGPVGQFSHRDELVALFTELGCHPHMLEMHHGHNPVIELAAGDILSNDASQLDLSGHIPSQATASWELFYQLINTAEKTLTQLAIIYSDKYLKLDDDWQIQSSVTKTISTMVMSIDGDSPKIIHLG